MARKLVIDINYPSQPLDKPDTKTKMRPTVAEANRLLEHGTLGDARTTDYGVPGMKKGVQKTPVANFSTAPVHAGKHAEMVRGGWKHTNAGQPYSAMASEYRHPVHGTASVFPSGRVKRHPQLRTGNNTNSPLPRNV